MQHITNIFIGNSLVNFRDKFAATFRQLHPTIEPSTFTALSLTEGKDGEYTLSVDADGDPLDKAAISKENRRSRLYNFFEDLYGRKVTVAHPGNQSMVIVLWAKLYLDDNAKIIEELLETIRLSKYNFRVEVAGFTHDAVTCFISNPADRLPPDVYRACFVSNIAKLRQLRPLLSAVRLIANRNMNNVALDLNEETMARVCSEFADTMCEHYLDIHPHLFNTDEVPFESFGISSIVFDVQYYLEYLRNQIIVEKLEVQNVDQRKFNINSLANYTNPVILNILNQIQQFHQVQAANAKAQLSIAGNASISNVVGTIDHDIKAIIEELNNKVQQLLSSKQISIFEGEALLALLLGEDSAMFDSSPVNAQEQTIDDIIEECSDFFQALDEDHTKLRNVSQTELKDTRKRMRNIASGNRQREERLKQISAQHQKEIIDNHFSDKGYHFGNTFYKVDLTIDNEPLAEKYETHAITCDNIDLSHIFTPVRTQGSQGSCSAFAVGSVIEAMAADGNRYSPAFLYYMARKAKGKTDEDCGASLYDIIKCAMQQGVCTEENMPYCNDIFSLAPTQEALHDAKNCKVLEAKIVDVNLGSIKSALVDGFPVLIASKIFNSFSDTHSGFVSLPTAYELEQNSRDDGHGRHAMVVCGFSDRERVFRVRNSWGTDFGQNGYCYIPYSYATQYFIQACIITKVDSASTRHNIEGAKTLNFNTNDRNIEAAILRNLIAEDNRELQYLAEKSDYLKTSWSYNVGVLGNINNQIDLVDKTKNKINERIEDEALIIKDLQNNEGCKIKEFKRSYLRNFLSLLFVTIVSLIAFFFSDHHVPKIILGIVATIDICMFGRYEYRWRRFRQDQRDDIQYHASQISLLQQKKEKLDINAHVYGTILREAESCRNKLQSQYRDLSRYNQAWVDLYESTREKLNTMTQNVPYPFLAVLDNESLKEYYTLWHDNMIRALDLNTILTSFTQTGDLAQSIMADRSIEQSIMRGLRGFSLKAYFNKLGHEQWQFLPNNADLANTIPDLDHRATPFSPYTPNDNTAIEKYIVVKDITQEEVNNIARYFPQTPQPIKGNNPYAISVLNIVRYNI